MRAILEDSRNTRETSIAMGFGPGSAADVFAQPGTN